MRRYFAVLLRGLLGLVLAGGAIPIAVAAPRGSDLIAVCVQGSYAACGLINREGNWSLQPWYSKIAWGGIGWRMETWGTVGMLSPEGKEIFAPRFADLRNYAEGLAPAQELLTEKWGFVDAAGNWVIAPRFLAASAFHGATGRALRRRDGHPDDAEWGQIDRQGRWIKTLPDYFEASPRDPAPLSWFKRQEWKDWFLQRSSLALLESHGADFVLARHENEERYLDLTGRVILTLHKQAFCERVDEVQNGRGERVWPADPEAMCLFLKHENDRAFSAEAPAMRQRIAVVYQDWVKHERMIDDARLTASDGAFLPFLQREPSIRAIAEAYRTAPWQRAAKIMLAPGVSIELPGDARFLAADAATVLDRREAQLREIFQARMAAPRANGEARQSGASVPLQRPSVPAAGASIPASEGGTSASGRMALIAPPNRRWKTRVMVLERGHLSLESLTRTPAALLDNARSTRFFDMSGRSLQHTLDAVDFHWVIQPHVDRQIGAYVHAEATLGTCRILWAVPGRQQTVILLTEWREEVCASKIDFYAEEIEALAASVHFSPGQAYADWQPGEPRSSLTLDQLAEGPPSADALQLRQGVGHMLQQEEENHRRALWRAIRQIGLVALAGGILFAARSRRR